MVFIITTVALGRRRMAAVAACAHSLSYSHTHKLSEKEEAKQKEYAERVAQARMLEKARQKQIKKHMGAIKYYLMPHKRAKYDELYPPPRQRPVRRP